MIHDGKNFVGLPATIGGFETIAGSVGHASVVGSAPEPLWPEFIRRTLYPRDFEVVVEIGGAPQ